MTAHKSSFTGNNTLLFLLNERFGPEDFATSFEAYILN